MEQVLADVATGLWRLHRRMASDSPDIRQVRRILEVLSDADIRIDDHLGVAFDPGLAIDVVAYQPTEGLDRDVVIDTERPSIFHGAATLQRGRVVVGVPQSGGTT